MTDKIEKACAGKWIRCHSTTRLDCCEILLEDGDDMILSNGDYSIRCIDYVGEVGAVQTVSGAFARAELCMDPACEHNLRPAPTDPMTAVDNAMLKAAIAELDEEIAEMSGRNDTGSRTMVGYMKSMRHRMVHAALRAVKSS